MLTKKYDLFCETVKKGAANLNNKISEADFDNFIEGILLDTSLNLPTAIYGRDGFAMVNEVDKNVVQIVAFQINSFAAGIFKDEIARFCTPILLTVRLLGSRPHLNHELKDCSLSIDEVYLGKNFCGSKGQLCDRESFFAELKKLIQVSRPGSLIKNVCSRLISTNYICHHIAETLGYAYGALDTYWTTKEKQFFLTAASFYNQQKDELRVDIIDSFSKEKMRCFFKTAKYGKLLGKADEFNENKDLILLEVEINDDIQSFYIPSGYQKISKKLFSDNVRVVTTQHIIEHILADYYKRSNAFVVSNSFQVLESLSRGLMAKIEGNKDEGGRYIKNASACKGQHPEMDLIATLAKEDKKFPEFASEFAYGMFFRPPIIT